MFNQTKVILAGLCLLMSITSVFAAHPVRTLKAEWELIEATEQNLKRCDELAKVILKGNPEERKVAVNEMIELNLGTKIILEKIENANDPKLKRAYHILMANRVYWSPMDEGYLPFTPVNGITEKGKRLYLVKAEIEGELLIGKMCGQTKAGHFPSGGKEVVSKDFKVMQSAAQWTSCDKELKIMKSMGVNKQGKRVYAARAWINNGIHIGTFIEGSEKALIPVDGKVHELKEFEVMVNYGTIVKGELQSQLFKMMKKFPMDAIARKDKSGFPNVNDADNSKIIEVFRKRIRVLNNPPPHIRDLDDDRKNKIRE